MQDFCSQPLTLDSSRGRAVQLESPEESLGWEALGKDMGEKLPGSLCLVIAINTTASIFPEAISSSLEKLIPFLESLLTTPCISTPPEEAVVETESGSVG